MNRIIALFLLIALVQSCSDSTFEKKGFQVREISEDESGQKIVGLHIDSLKLETRPRNVLLTKSPNHRLTPIYKVNYNKRTGKPFTGSNRYHTNWGNDKGRGNNWNNNFMPGFEAIYGYNFINVSHYNIEKKTQNVFFDKPVLIKTLYYPTFSEDTLNNQPVTRDFYMVSVYDEDSNNDGFISVKDLRRFYLFDMEGNKKNSLVPNDYSVMNSEYDSGNDFMYVFAKADLNENGQMDNEEPIHVFWIDLQEPENNGMVYQN